MDWRRHRGLALALAVVAAVGVFAARRTSVEPQPVPPAATAQPAEAALMALPEVAQWRAEAGTQARVSAVARDGEVKTVDGRDYRPWRVQRETNGAARALQDFYVTDDGTRILVAQELGRTITLDEWRVKREAARAAESRLKPLPPLPPVSG